MSTHRCVLGEVFGEFKRHRSSMSTHRCVLREVVGEFNRHQSSMSTHRCELPCFDLLRLSTAVEPIRINREFGRIPSRIEFEQPHRGDSVSQFCTPSIRSPESAASIATWRRARYSCLVRCSVALWLNTLAIRAPSSRPMHVTHGERSGVVNPSRLRPRVD